MITRLSELDKWGQSKGCTTGQRGGPITRAVPVRDHWEVLDRRSKTLKGEVLTLGSPKGRSDGQDQKAQRGPDG